jgi:D-alanyl-D-alanine endopeptidase (penicillin-binding protein 7)
MLKWLMVVAALLYATAAFAHSANTDASTSATADSAAAHKPEKKARAHASGSRQHASKSRVRQVSKKKAAARHKRVRHTAARTARSHHHHGKKSEINLGHVARAVKLTLRSSAALVIDQDAGRVLYSKNVDNIMPIASITKLMTAMVMLDAHPALDQKITIIDADKDELKHSRSRLRVGTVLSRYDMLRLALMASENRAAAALGRTTFPGGTSAFVAAMNRKAASLGMWNTHFVEPTGLNSHNVSTAQDLVKMVEAAYHYALIRQFTTTTAREVEVAGGRTLEYHNSNTLVKNHRWHIGLSKTGFTNEAGRCLVMQTAIAERPVIIVLLDSWGRYSRIGDANRIRKWIETSAAHQPFG